MQFVLVATAALFLYLDTPATAAPTGSLLFGEDGALELNNIKIPEIADGVHEWFKGMKDRVFGTSAPPDIIAVIDSAKNSYEQQKKFFDSLLIDMSKLTFSPEDWGFRLGRWYVIKKDSEDWMSAIWNIFRPRLLDGPTIDDWLEFDFDNEKNPVVPPFTTIIPVIPPEDKPPETTEVVTIRDNETRDQ